MAKKVKVRMSDADVIAVMKSTEVEAELLDIAGRVADRAGDGFGAELGTGGKTRSRAFVQAETWRAVGRNARDGTLQRALGGIS